MKYLYLIMLDYHDGEHPVAYPIIANESLQLGDETGNPEQTDEEYRRLQQFLQEYHAFTPEETDSEDIYCEGPWIDLQPVN